MDVFHGAASVWQESFEDLEKGLGGGISIQDPEAPERRSGQQWPSFSARAAAAPAPALPPPPTLLESIQIHNNPWEPQFSQSLQADTSVSPAAEQPPSSPCALAAKSGEGSLRWEEAEQRLPLTRRAEGETRSVFGCFESWRGKEASPSSCDGEGALPLAFEGFANGGFSSEPERPFPFPKVATSSPPAAAALASEASFPAKAEEGQSALVTRSPSLRENAAAFKFSQEPSFLSCSVPPSRLARTLSSCSTHSSPLSGSSSSCSGDGSPASRSLQPPLLSLEESCAFGAGATATPVVPADDESASPCLSWGQDGVSCIGQRRTSFSTQTQLQRSPSKRSFFRKSDSLAESRRASARAFCIAVEMAGESEQGAHRAASVLRRSLMKPLASDAIPRRRRSNGRRSREKEKKEGPAPVYGEAERKARLSEPLRRRLLQQYTNCLRVLDRAKENAAQCEEEPDSLHPRLVQVALAASKLRSLQTSQ